MTAALLFAATFGVVFALGLQSLNVNGGHKVLAFVTSFAIGISNLVLFKVLPGPTDAWQIAAYLLGGPFGIVASMLAHPWLVRLLRRLKHEPPAPPRQAGAGHASPAQGGALHQLAMDLLHPEQLGRLAHPEIRDRARHALGMQTIDPAPRRPQQP